MVKSMTGFGRAEISDEKHRILVEMKAVNHRYLDFNIKLPKKLYLFESRIRTEMKSYTERGKLDIFVSYEDFSDSQMVLRYHQQLAEEYMAYFRQMSEQFGIPNDISVSDIATLPEIFTMEQADEDEEYLWTLVEEAIRQAAARLVEQRVQEGSRLKQDILGKLCVMEKDVSFVEVRSPEIEEAYRERLNAKVRELLDGNSVDETRILTEVALFADKTCVDEETVRLRSHIAGMREALDQETGESVGRRLDFIAQEMNREANTILSKCGSMDVSAAAIRLKTEIEKIREQVQNIE